MTDLPNLFYVQLQEQCDGVTWVKVVRCKDCIHNSLNRKSGNAYCDLGIGLFQLYDYCSRGERREDADK